MSTIDKKGITFKIFLLGDTKVGKTSYVLRALGEAFEAILFQTIGVDYKTKKVMLEPKVYGNIELWDTAGQERLQSLAKNLLKKADGVFLLYDVTDQKTFNNISHWVDDTKNNASSKTKVMLIGNKSDAVNDRVVTYVDGERLSKQYDIPFFETSCKENTNINESLELMVHNVYCLYKENSQNHKNPDVKSLVSHKKKKKSTCC